MSVEAVGIKEVTERFQNLPERARASLRQSIGVLVLKLQARVMRQKLSGQVLNVKTGRLRRSIDQVVRDNGDDIAGVVSSNVEYARAHEYGFSGQESVKAHLRTIKQAFGKPLKAPVAFQVRAHARKANVPEKSFLRSALSDMKPEIQDAMRKAVGRALK